MEIDQGIDNKVVIRRLKMGLTLHPAYPLLVTSLFTYLIRLRTTSPSDACYSDIIVALVF